jgi:hypothetical protein
MEGGKGRAAALAVFFLRNMLRCAWSLMALRVIFCIAAATVAIGPTADKGRHCAELLGR